MQSCLEMGGFYKASSAKMQLFLPFRRQEDDKTTAWRH